MAFKQPYTIKFSDSEEVLLQFLHEIIETPLEQEKKLFEMSDGFYAPHVNDNYCELIFFNAGSRDIRIGNYESVFKAGDILVVRPDEEHCGRSHSCILDRYYIHISRNSFEGLKNEGQSIMGIFFDREKYTNNKITLLLEEQRQVQKLLMQLDNIVRFGDEKTKDIESYAIVIQILSLLNKHFKGIKDYKSQKSEFFLGILSYIENSYSDADIMSSLLKNFGVSRSNLWRMFKEEMNITPTGYLQKVRMENAKLILEQGCDVTSTSIQCGFSDCSHFIKKFKEWYGVTPLKYKKNLTDNSWGKLNNT
jgi:AraC-like DNA-binding protein